MSAEDVKQVIGRAVLDAEYREMLFSDPDSALEDYDLTKEELAGLKNIEREKFDTMAGALEERMSRAGIGLQTLGGRIKISEQNMTKFNQSMREFGGSALAIFTPFIAPTPQ